MKLFGDFLTWFVFLLLITGALVGGGMYLLHTRFDEAVRTHVEAKFRRAYPEHLVSLESARRIDGQGIELRGLKIAEPSDSGEPLPAVEIEEMLLQCNAAVEELLGGKLEARQLVMRGLKINAVLGENGQWNLARLFPLPKLGAQQVPILIENSSAEISGTSPQPVVLAIQQLQLTPSGAGPPSTAAPPAKTWSFQGMLGSSQVQRIAVAGTYDVVTQLWRAGGQIQGLRVGHELAGVLPPQLQECTSWLEAWHLIANAQFQATNEGASDTWPHFTVEGEAHGRIEDRRLPMPLTDIRAQFTSNGRSLEIPKLTARAGQSTLEADCRIDGFYEDAPCSLHLTAKRLRVDRQLVASLPDELHETWSRLAPEGEVDAEVELTFDGREVQHFAIVDCHDVSFAYDKFPYRLAQGQGRVEWRDNTLRFERFQAFASGRLVEIDGEVKNPGPNYSGFVEVRVDEKAVPIEETLIESLPDSARRVVHQLHPVGGLTLWARFERQDSDPPIAKKEFKIGLENCSMKYENFPYPLSHINGVIHMVNDQWTLQDLEGVNDTARVLCNGEWGPDERGITQLSLTFIADDVPLDDELRNALRPDTQKVWTSLNPRGSLDKLEATVFFDGKSRKTRVNLTATKHPPAQNVTGRTITIKPSWMPYQLDEVEGTLKFQDGITELHNIRGRNRNTVLQLSGQVETDQDGEWHVHISPLNIDRMEMTHELTAALPRRLGEALTKLHITGPVSMSGTMDLNGAKGSASPRSSKWNLDFDIENGQMHCGVLLEHIHGRVNLAGAVDQKGLSSQGSVDIDSLFYHGIQFTRVQGPISIDDERLGIGEWVTHSEGQAHPHPLRARVFGGTLVSSSEVALSGDYPFRLESRLFDADLATISREATSRRADVSGRTSADLRLVGTSKGTHTLRGTGNVRLTEADIYELPVMVSLLKLLRLKRPDGTAFTSSDLDYHIEGDRIYFDSIHFAGDAISMDGTGDMTLDRTVNLTFYTSLTSDNISDRLLGPILKEAGKQLLEITVTGTLDDPKFSREPLRNIRENIQNIFPSPAPTSRPVMSRLPETIDPAERLSSPR